LVIGESLIDIVDAGADRTELVGGSPANVALGLGRRDVQVGLLTHLADDPFGRRITRHLEASGVYVLPESVHAQRTPTALASIGHDGQAEYEFDLTWSVRSPHDLDPRIVHTGSIAAFLEPGAGDVRNILRNSSARDVTFEDAAWLYPGLSPDVVLEAVLGLGPRLAAITLGSSGAIIVTPDVRQWVPAVPVQTVDTIGAGDTFMSSLICAVLEHGSEHLDSRKLQSMGRDAAAAAAITVSRAGADLPWAGELAAGGPH
jgi:fructokinase